MRDLPQRAPFVLFAGYLCLGLAWLGSNPPAAAPEEPEHYLRALAIGLGDLVGQPTSMTPMLPTNAAQAAHLTRVTRSVLVPPGLEVPPSWFCTVANHQASARCLTTTVANRTSVRQATNEAGSLPYLYVPSGLAMRLAGNATQALFLARLANAVIAYSLLLAAVVLLWDGGSAVSMLGLPVAVTPMVLFVGTAIGPSGPEVAASAAFLAFLLRLTRRAEAPRWAWVAGISAGAVLTLARPLGPFWMVSLVLVAVALAGRAQVAAVARRAPHALTIGACGLVAAAAMNLGWAFFFFPPAAHSASELAGFLLPSLASVPEAVGEAIGVFGWQDTLMPRLMYGVWGIAWIMLMAPALLRGTLRERRTLDALVLGAGAAIVLVSALVVIPVGFAVQGRHILPIFLALPLVAGEVLYRNRDRVGPPTLAWLAAVTGTLAALVQLSGWYANAHRYAVGTAGPWLFLGSADWNPVGGWATWFALAAGGSALLVFAAFAAYRSRLNAL